MDQFRDAEFREEQAKAVAGGVRLRILKWLKTPERHFGHQTTGPPDEIGVCVTLITEKLGMSQPTVSRHLELLKRARLLKVNRIGRWSFFSRDEDGLNEFREWINEALRRD